MGRLKFPRNDPCFCGSGIKFKKCHLNRDSEPAVEHWEVRNHMASHGLPKKCFHASNDQEHCFGKIIDAHTVSKSGSLRKISRAGKVYCFGRDIGTLFANKGKTAIKEIGVSQASVFPGFCSFHDKNLFSPFEDKNFEMNEINAFLIGYRALCREIYTKENAKSLLPFMRTMDRGKNSISQLGLQQYLSDYDLGVDYGLRDLQVLKQRYDKIFTSSDYSTVNYFIIEYDEVPHILYSGAIYPEYDFNGNELQDLTSSKIMEGIAINAIATQTGGAVIFQWNGVGNINQRLVGSLYGLTPKSWASLLTQFAFETLENLYISPDWWDQLPLLSKNSLEKKVMCGASKPHSKACFMDDGSRYAFWSSPKIHTNLKF